MSNLIDIQSQIEKLQKQANEIKAREFDTTVQDIQAKMRAFGITVKDLQAPKGRGAKGKVKTTKVATAGASPKVAGVQKKAATPVAAKYRGPNGEGWSGRGLMPKWMSALVAQGRTKEDFTIQA
jgi:DNA-binding protein H-NS